MRLVRIFKRGRVLNKELYDRLKILDFKIFFECGNEFKPNRDWWVIVCENKIIAYCGCLYTYDGICIFVRAWVFRDYRGKGIQSKMIKARLEAAREQCEKAITYTTNDNVHSINNLFKNGFILYYPHYSYAGKDKLYFLKNLK